MNPLAMWTFFRSQVEAYASVVGGRFINLIWIGALCVGIWIFGPRLEFGGYAPLAPATNRLYAIAALLGGWLIYAIVSWWRQRRAERALIDGATTETPEQRARAEAREDVAQLRTRLKSALKTMRKVARRRSGYAYAFPWYLMMGAPGAGKTTLVQNSGLKFPLGEAEGAEPVAGVGGTRDCNWWFTDRAILIDTAGRYTTQDSARERDSAGFLGFLSMLRRTRRSQPINGVVLTFSLTDLMTQDPAERLSEVRAVRQRLAEVEETLRARVPVYLVLTKADRLPGFDAFFEGMGAQAREQVWGMTFDPDEAAPGTLPDLFTREYRALQDRLAALLPERLQTEADIDRRGAVFRFPAQVAALHDALREIVEELASGTEGAPEPMIRGVYIASATQEVEARRSAAMPARAMNRAYFVSRLFGDVILNEAALVTRDQRLTRRRRILTGAAYGVAALAALGLVVSWSASYAFNRRALADADASLALYAERAAAIPVRDVSDADFLRVLPALDAVREVPRAFQGEGEEPPIWQVGFGLDQGSRIAERHADVYADALGAYLLPRYMVALQDRLRGDLDDAEAFETLKHYLSLAGLGPVDDDALLLQAERVFEGLYPGSGRAPTRASLMGHMEAMLDRGTLPVLAIDDALVAETREAIAARSPARRALDLLETREAARALGQWTPAAALGPAGARAFERASGAPLTEGIAGLYTRAGYRTVVVTRLPEMAEVAAGEGWVRGPGAAQVNDVSAVAAEAAELYWTEFTQSWRETVSDLRVRDVASPGDAADLLTLLASETDPLRRLAADVAEATDLAGDAEAAEALTANLPFDPLAAPDPYEALRRTLAEAEAAEEGDGPLAEIDPLLAELAQQLGRASASDARAAEVFDAGGPLTQAAQDLAAEGRSLPTPLDLWTVGLASEVAQATVERARDALSELWTASGARECERAVTGRYPFAPEAEPEVTLDDFTRIFGPNGLFGGFFEENLAGFVDRSSDPWTWTGGLGTAGESSEALAQFQRADAIRRAFFADGAAAPEVEVTLDLVRLDTRARVALMEIGGERSVHGLDRAERETLVWPGEGVTARLTLLPGERDRSVTETGEWAPFRLFDRAETRPVSDNRFEAAYDVSGREAVFTVTAGSVNNPFRLPAIEAFQCPESLLE